MPIRWVISPVVVILEPGLDEETGLPTPPVPSFRGPKVRALTDPSTGKNYCHSSAIDAGNWALSFVRSDDFSAIDADPDCHDVLQRDYEDWEGFLARTPRLELWNAQRRNRLANLITARAGTTSGLTQDSEFWRWLERLGKLAMPSFTPLGTWVK